MSEVLQFPQLTAAFAVQQKHRVDLDALDPGWTQEAGALRSGQLEQALRRALDILLSLLLLALAMPLLAATALAVRLESPGPVIYRQIRAGLHARPFTLLKFRSMRQRRRGGTPVWAAPNDPRVTAVGRVIRMLRIDELPQLLNVLRGEMSLIGPRPERPVFVEQLAARSRSTPTAAGSSRESPAGRRSPALRRLHRGRPPETRLRPLLRAPPQPGAGRHHPARHRARRAAPPGRALTGRHRTSCDPRAGSLSSFVLRGWSSP